MVTDPKPTRKKRKRRPHEEDVYFVVAIEDWDWGYSLSLNTDKKAIDPYHEFRHLHLRGRQPAGAETDSKYPILSSSDPQRRSSFGGVALGANSLSAVLKSGSGAWRA
ncbi:hypothetical protein [Bradyrhizobium australafricanum]|uniref:hypothetical protein n=1 Tax=Bradyrhizobium australafricanum TaxID=2821406 RepID=UPI001CE35398|nr:hypothetical protein [Bradyrhizobium australafricanum]MCA6098156.1 hypothetical protein [Bradyrhizobium australafricanum]